VRSRCWDARGCCSGLPPRLGTGIRIVPGARLGVERRGLGGGEGWVAADLDLGRGEWWREEARWAARVWGSGFVRWVGELGKGGEYGLLDEDHLTVQTCSVG
jgi:hypothetical protein